MAGAKKKKSAREKVIEKIVSQYKKRLIGKKKIGKQDPPNSKVLREFLRDKYEALIKKLQTKILNAEKLRKEIKELRKRSTVQTYLKRNLEKGIRASRDPRNPPKKKIPTRRVPDKESKQ